MKTKSRNYLITSLTMIVMMIAILFSVVAIAPLTAYAASGTGTENDPVYVTNYAELKEALERDSDTWIVVDNFNNGNYYTLVSGVDYTQTSLDESAYACGAINIPTGKNKHLTINTTIDCRTASTQSGSLLYSFINNRGNLTIDGSGTIAVSFNAGNYANAIIFNQGNLIIDAPITLDATCKTVQSYGRAIMNHTGTFTISDGTYIGFKSNTLGTSGNVGALWQACQNINKESIIIGGQFQLKNENGIISDGYALVNGGVDNLTLKGGTFYGIYASQYSLKLSALLGSYCKFQKSGVDFNGSSLSDSTYVLSVVNTNLIPTVNLTVTAPMNGDNPSAPSISTENTTIYAYEWKDSSESNMSSFSTFVGGETYRLQVRINTIKEFSKNTKVYINGQIATVKSFAENYILCYIDYIASNEQIDTVQVGLDTPMVGGNVTAPYTYTNTVDLTLYEWYPDVTKYEAGHNYKLTFRIAPKTGYEFSDDVKVVINGKQATITSQGKDFAVCEYSFEFAAQEPETVNEIIITVDNPVAGGTSPTPTVTSNQYTLGMYEWTPSEFVADSNSRLTVLAYPSSGYKFVDGTTTAKVNGQTATISVGSGFARIEYTFIVSTPSYTVSFNANGGTGSMSDETDQFGGLVLPECDFTAPAGKQFKCWAEGSASGAQYAPGEEYDVTGNVTFFAVWEDNLYQVIYQPGEASGNNEVYEYEANDTITFLGCDVLGYTSEGFELDYWSIRILGDNFTEVAQKRAGETYTLTTNIIAVAMWKEIPVVKYNVSFNANGGSGSMNPVEFAGEYTLPSCTFTAPTGYEFKCWSVNEVEKAVGDEITITADTTVKAVWKAKSYTITFNTDGGSAIDPITQDYGTTVTAPSNPTKMGYTFAGWDKTIPSTMPAENMTITATWEINEYTITFNTNGGSAIDPITQNYGTAVVAPSNPTKTGYTFAGWDKTIPSTMPAENMTITATWTINQYTITFNTNGGSAIDPITQDYGTAIVAPANPTKSGYIFTGWDKTIPSTMPAENMTITAQWTEVIPNTYIVTYTDGVDNVELFADQVNANITGGAATPAFNGTPAREGYNFAGWTPSVAGTVTANATYTATWTINQYTITFNTNGGSAIDPITQNYGTAVVAPSNPTKTGYTFAGWDKTIPSTMPAENMTITAQWTEVIPNTYTVTYTDGVDNVELFADQVNANITEGAATPAFNGTPAREGYTFAGWTPSVAGTVTANVTYTATWELIPVHTHDYGTTWKSDENNHWNECACGDKANTAPHADANNDGKCDICDYAMGTPENPGGDKESEKTGLSGGAIAGIAVGSAAVAGLGGFSLFWFVIKKKKFADLIALFKKK